MALIISSPPYNIGKVFGGWGNGEAMAANKIRGIRAALCHDVSTARLSRQHNDANVLALGARITGPTVAADIVRVWLEATFEGGRHARRIEKIHALERAEENPGQGEGGGSEGWNLEGVPLQEVLPCRRSTCSITR